MSSNLEVSPVKIVQAVLDQIEATNPQVNAIVTVTDNAFEAAKASVMRYIRPYTWRDF